MTKKTIPHHPSLKTRMTPMLATTIRYLIYKQHILTAQSYLCVAKCNSTVMVMITLIIFAR